MPVYTYHCENCEHEFEKYQTFSEDALKTCPECKKKKLRKVYKPALVLFKGSGYYVTDNKGAHSSLNTTNTASSDNGSGDKTEKKTEKKKTEKTKAKVKED
jgi:putative FmdB family regulatory protein